MQGHRSLSAKPIHILEQDGTWNLLKGTEQESVVAPKRSQRSASVVTREETNDEAWGELDVNLDQSRDSSRPNGELAVQRSGKRVIQATTPSSDTQSKSPAGTAGTLKLLQRFLVDVLSPLNEPIFHVVVERGREIGHEPTCRTWVHWDQSFDQDARSSAAPACHDQTEQEVRLPKTTRRKKAGDEIADARILVSRELQVDIEDIEGVYRTREFVRRISKAAGTKLSECPSPHRGA